MDEKTPHIHATIVPIVTGQRRKAGQDQKSGKKKYRTKSAGAPRLCADDVMSRIKLKEYQDSYAGAMNKYGLQRGRENSESSHISTRVYYNDLINNQQSLQENIEELLKVEELKRRTIEQLNDSKQEVLSRYEEITTLKEQTETELNKTHAELKEVKSQLKTEKFKSSAADAGSKIMEGLSYAFGTSKVKLQQQEIANLRYENATLKHDIAELNQTINQERKDNEKTIAEFETELNNIYE